jgi:hypothetical protein
MCLNVIPSDFVMSADQEIVVRSARGDVVFTKRYPGSTPLSQIISDAKLKSFREAFSYVDIPDGEDLPRVGGSGDNHLEDSAVLIDATTLRAQKSLWNTEEDFTQVDLGKSSPETIKLFSFIYPPNILSNRLAVLEQFELLSPKVWRCFLLPIVN